MDLTPIPAADRLGVAAELPQKTPGISAPPMGGSGMSENAHPETSQVQNVQPPALEPGDPGPHDPLIHESPPRLTQGRWAKRRGNAARKAKGLPPSGKVFSKAATGIESASQPVPAEVGTPQVSKPPPPELLAGPPPPLPVDGVPAPEGIRPLTDYAATAGGIIDGLLGFAQIVISPAWEPKPAERSVLIGSAQRLMHHYQTPVVGPILDFIFTLFGFAVKRKDDVKTRSFFGGLWDRIKPKRQPSGLETAAAAPTQAPPPPMQTLQPAVNWG